MAYADITVNSLAYVKYKLVYTAVELQSVKQFSNFI